MLNGGCGGSASIITSRSRRIFTAFHTTSPIGDPTYADAILDRIVHNAHRIDLTGDSLRRMRPRSTSKD
jgi:DNA replication protein DnaC